MIAHFRNKRASGSAASGPGGGRGKLGRRDALFSTFLVSYSWPCAARGGPPSSKSAAILGPVLDNRGHWFFRDVVEFRAFARCVRRRYALVHALVPLFRAVWGCSPGWRLCSWKAASPNAHRSCVSASRSAIIEQLESDPSQRQPCFDYQTEDTEDGYPYGRS